MKKSLYMVLFLLLIGGNIFAIPPPGPVNGLLTKVEDVLDPQHTALLVIDMQNDFAHPPGEAIVPSINALVDNARKNGVFLVYVGLNHSLTVDSPPYMARYALRGLDPKNLLVQEGTPKTDWVPGLRRPEPTEHVVVKYGYDAFQDTNLEALLRNRGIRSLVLTGANTNLCIESTAFRAFSKGYYVTLPPDGVASYDPKVHAVALDNMAQFIADTTPSAQIIQYWNMKPHQFYTEKAYYPARKVPPTPPRIGPANGILTSLRMVAKPEYTALLIIDMQEDFIGKEGKAAKSGIDTSAGLQIIPKINELIKSARTNGVDVFYVRLEHSVITDSPNYMARYTRRGLSPDNLLVKAGTKGADLIEGLLQPLPGERIVVKYGYDAFQDTDLGALLKNRGIRSLVFTGVNTNLCVQASLLRAFADGFYSVVPKDAVASTDQKLNDYSIANFQRFFSIISSVEELTKLWSGRE